MKNKVIVFDLDGTLLNTIEDLKEACNYALQCYGYEPISLLEAQAFIGNGIRKLMERSLKGKLEKFNEVFLTFKAYYTKNCNVHTTIYEGIMEILQYLKINHIKMAVLSNKAQEPLNQLCEFYFKEYFDIVLGDRPDIEKKPSPMGLQKICEFFGVSMENVLYIGDSEVDVQTVRNASCEGLFVSYGFRSLEELKKAGAGRICKTPAEILNFLKQE